MFLSLYLLTCITMSYHFNSYLYIFFLNSNHAERFSCEKSLFNVFHICKHVTSPNKTNSSQDSESGLGKKSYTTHVWRTILSFDEF